MEIDGVPLHRIHRATLRRRLIAVPQDTVLLPDGSSIRDNLDPYSVATDMECHAVLETVRLSEFLEEHGGSIYSSMSADRLSAGQKQLFSLGRAILRRRVKDERLGKDRGRGGGVLLLDEVSSSVDHETDRAMQDIIRHEFKNYTIIMVSHRLEMVMDFFDEVIVLDKGRIVEKGNPSELVAQETSRFRQLWAIENRKRS